MFCHLQQLFFKLIYSYNYTLPQNTYAELIPAKKTVTA